MAATSLNSCLGYPLSKNLVRRCCVISKNVSWSEVHLSALSNPLDNGWEGVSRVTGAVVQELLWVGWLHKKFAVQHSSAPKSSAFIQLEVQEGGELLQVNLMVDIWLFRYMMNLSRLSLLAVHSIRMSSRNLFQRAGRGPSQSANAFSSRAARQMGGHTWYPWLHL